MWSQTNNHLTRIFLILAVGLMVNLTATEGQANPYLNLKGSWKGSGTISPSGEKKERVICRVRYNVGGGGRNISQNISCAGTDYKVSVSGDLRYRKGRISGSFNESHYGVNGRVTGTARNSSVRLKLSSPEFQGRMSIRVSSKKRHYVTISQFDQNLRRYVPLASIRLRRRR